MKTRTVAIIGFGFLVVFGVSLNFYFYQHVIAPVDSSIGHLDGIISTFENESIRSHLVAVKQNLSRAMEALPENKNPVWIFPAENTDFLRIERDIDTTITTTDKIGDIPRDASAYRTGIMDIHNRSNIMKENLLDARGFMYASATNILFTLIWIGGVAGITKAGVGDEDYKDNQGNKRWFVL